MKTNLFWSPRRMSLGEKPNKMIGESLWRLLARRREAKLEREQMWDALEQYERPKSLTPFLLLNVAAFYTGVVAAAITEQLHKVRDWIKPPSCFSTLAELCIPSASVSLVKCILQTTGPSQIRVFSWGFPWAWTHLIICNRLLFSSFPSNSALMIHSFKFSLSLVKCILQRLTLHKLGFQLGFPLSLNSSHHLRPVVYALYLSLKFCTYDTYIPSNSLLMTITLWLRLWLVFNLVL